MGALETERTEAGTSLAYFGSSKKAMVAGTEGIARGDPEVGRGAVDPDTEETGLPQGLEFCMFPTPSSAWEGSPDFLCMGGGERQEGNSRIPTRIPSMAPPCAHGNGARLGHSQ